MDNKYDQTISDSKSESILKAIELFENDNRKEIKRPNIKVKKILLQHLIVLIFFALFCAACLLWLKLIVPLKYVVVFLIASGLILFILRLKRICIDFVLLYQRLAPERIRKSCLFEPSCSEYMLLAIEKYGVFKGLFKGIKRLLRCHPPNGGVDYP